MTKPPYEIENYIDVNDPGFDLETALFGITNEKTNRKKIISETKPIEIERHFVGSKIFKFQCLEDVVMRNPDWLWEPFLIEGNVNILTGDPGLGKSTLVCEIASQLTRGGIGKGLPGKGLSYKSPQNVWLMNAEDNAEDTIKGRIYNQGGDMRRCFVTDVPVALDARHFREMARLVRENNIKFLAVDPVQGWVGGGMNMNQANEVREWGSAFRSIAQEYKCTVLMVRHRRKGAPDDSSIYSGMGSIDFTAASRSEISIFRGPGNTVQLMRIKGNTGLTGVRTLYEIEKHPDPANAHGKLVWQDDGEVEIGDFNEHSPVKRRPRGEKKVSTRPKNFNAAVKFIRDMLRTGPKPANEVLQAGTEAGYSLLTLKVAAETAKVRVEQDLWSL